MATSGSELSEAISTHAAHRHGVILTACFSAATASSVWVGWHVGDGVQGQTRASGRKG